MLAIIIFVLPPSARIWVALFVLVLVIYWRGKQGASIIDAFTQKVYGG